MHARSILAFAPNERLSHSLPAPIVKVNVCERRLCVLRYGGKNCLKERRCV